MTKAKKQKNGITLSLAELVNSMANFMALIDSPKPNDWAFKLSMLLNSEIKPALESFDETKAKLISDAGLTPHLTDTDAPEGETWDQMKRRKPEIIELINKFQSELEKLLSTEITLNFKKLNGQELVDYIEDYNDFQERLLEKGHKPNDKIFLRGEMLIDWLFD